MASEAQGPSYPWPPNAILRGRLQPSDLARYLSHLAILALALLMAWLGNLNPYELAVTTESPSPSGSNSLLPRRIKPKEAGFLVKATLPFTIIPERPRRGVAIYVVQSGDTVSGIAQKFGLQPETIQWSNSDIEQNPDLLYVGEELYILPIDGVYHRVQAKDTLESIAQEYKAEVSAILESEYNQIADPNVLPVGQMLVIPGGSKPYVPQVVYAGPPPAGATQGTGNFMWPCSGVITQGFWGGHRAIDIGAPEGSAVYAADAGYVAAVGSLGGYGNRILISHGDGWETLYAHLSQILVRAGTSVEKGQLIGQVGSTGLSTGPHLHFEVLQYGVQRNPFGLLP